MRSLEEEFSTRVGLILSELSWRNDFRIHPYLGLYALISAFKDSGFDVVPNDSTQQMKLGYRFRSTFGFSDTKVDYFSTKLAYRDISQPSRIDIPDSPGAYSAAISKAFGTLKCSNDLQPMRWRTTEEKLKKKVPRIFAKNLNFFFRKYHERMLVSVEGEIESPGKPKLFADLVRDGGLEDLREALEFEVTNELTHPSHKFEIAMRESIGKYLSRLADRKGYEPLNMDVNPEKFFTERQIGGFKDAKALQWNITSSRAT